MSLSNTIVRGSVLVVCVAGMVGTANAQAAASNSVSNVWSFSIDPLSVGSNLGVSNPLGEQIVNEFNIFPVPVAVGYGDASGSATLLTDSYDSVNWSGSNSSTMSAQAGPAQGTGEGSVGSGLPLFLTNNDSSNIILDVQSTLTMSVMASATGPNALASCVDAGGVGIAQGLGTAGETNQTPQVIMESIAPGTPIYVNNDGYQFVGQAGGIYTYTLETSITLTPGEEDLLEFDAEGGSYANVTPTPGSGCTLLFGLSALALLRNRRKKSA